ncbi:MAG TPA: TetR/AcrR family transcriptional regulator [Thermodesulfobacteriota bacterium]|nr:TetR/AcrR family transcriptional regulator [Thermodesulfobacteriota bacterium]
MNNIGLTKYEKKKGIILDATFKCIYEHGIKNLSLRSIAKEAKVNQSDLLYYFKNKENLLTEFIRTLFKKFMHNVEKGVNKLDSPEKKIEALLKRGVSFSSKQKNSLWYLLTAGHCV